MGDLVLSILLNEVQSDGGLVVIKIGKEEEDDIIDIFQVDDFNISKINEDKIKISIFDCVSKKFEYICSVENLENIIEYDNKILIPLNEKEEYLHIETY